VDTVACITFGPILIRHDRGMKWLQWNPDRADAIRLIGVMVVIVAGFAAVMTYLPNLQQHRANAGFGAGWDCVTQARGDPVCIKKSGR
jgi:hypothetical protein